MNPGEISSRKETPTSTRRSFSRTVFAAGIFALSAGLLAGTAVPGFAADKVTLVLANSQWLDRVRGDGLKAAMKEYEKANPNVEVTFQEIPSSQISTTLTTQVGAGQGPDLMMIQDDLFFRLAGAKQLLPIPATVTEGVTLNDTNAPAVVGGERLGVAWQRAPFGIMYNKDLLAKAGVALPTTTDELIAAAKKIKDATGVLGFGDLDISANASSYTEQVDLWTRGYGGSWATDGKLTIVTPENIKGVEELIKVAKSGILQQSQGFMSSGTLPPFQQGQVAMMTDCCGAISTALMGKVPGTSIGFAKYPVPQDIGMHEQLFVAVNKNTKNPDVALDFVKWFISPAGQNALRAASGSDPLATDVPLSPEFAAKNPWAVDLAELGKHTKTLMIDGWEVQSFQIRKIIVDNIQKAIIEGGSAEDALKAADAEIASQVKK
jgi:multiple sugar transport system substrate-binding protein